MTLEKTKVDYEIVNKEDPEFIKGSEGWIRTRCEHDYIDCKALEKKKNLNSHQKYEKKICEMAKRSEKSRDPFRGAPMRYH